jgi:PhzF family phenazine biosynthesis protein
MRIEYYHIDAFTENGYLGNPAGVCLINSFLPDEVMQRIAFENAVSETAFVVPHGNEYDIRWFTPETEVDLCGHATLAAAHVLFSEKGFKEKVIRFKSQSGSLSVEKDNEILVLDFPARPPLPCNVPPKLIKALGRKPVEVLASERDYLVIYAGEETVKNLAPDMDLLKQIDKFGIIITSLGEEVDFVSRFFAPAEGIPEDPVTGSAHCTLIPYWAKRLSKMKMVARQLSRRGGVIYCRDAGNRVKIGGKAVTYLHGYIDIEVKQ